MICYAYTGGQKNRWNVFAKPALSNAENVIEYLGRYTHRVAISNARILEIAKIRYYGIFANTHCNEVLDTYLSVEDKEMVLSLTEGKAWQDLIEEVLGYDPFRCKKCKKGKMLMHGKIDANPRAA